MGGATCPTSAVHSIIMVNFLSQHRQITLNTLTETTAQKPVVTQVFSTIREQIQIRKTIIVSSLINVMNNLLFSKFSPEIILNDFYMFIYPRVSLRFGKRDTDVSSSMNPSISPASVSSVSTVGTTESSPSNFKKTWINQSFLSTLFAIYQGTFRVFLLLSGLFSRTLQAAIHPPTRVSRYPLFYTEYTSANFADSLNIRCAFFPHTLAL